MHRALADILDIHHTQHTLHSMPFVPSSFLFSKMIFPLKFFSPFTFYHSTIPFIIFEKKLTGFKLFVSAESITLENVRVHKVV